MKQLTLLFIFVLTLSANAWGADAASGKAKYDSLCVSCHGPLGKGDGAASAALNPKPRNFADAALMKTRTDDQLKKVIQGGGAANGLSAVMPAWGAILTPADVDNVVAYIRTLAGK